MSLSLKITVDVLSDVPPAQRNDNDESTRIEITTIRRDFTNPLNDWLHLSDLISQAESTQANCILR